VCNKNDINHKKKSKGSSNILTIIKYHIENMIKIIHEIKKLKQKKIILILFNYKNL